MTRAAVRARQADAPPQPAQMVRVTVQSIDSHTVVVQLPGGNTSKAPRVAGCTYTVGGLAFALVQEPAVGPVFPIA